MQQAFFFSPLSSGLCQDGNTSSRVITEVKHLELNQFSVGSNFLRGGKCCCRKVGNMGCPFEIPFPLGPVHLVHHKGDLFREKKAFFLFISRGQL